VGSVAVPADRGQAIAAFGARRSGRIEASSPICASGRTSAGSCSAERLARKQDRNDLMRARAWARTSGFLLDDAEALRCAVKSKDLLLRPGSRSTPLSRPFVKGKSIS